MSTEINTYVKFDQITGGVTVPNYKDWIGIVEFSHGFQQKISTDEAQNKVASKAKHEPLIIKKVRDQTTSELLKKCWSGEKIKSAELHVTDSQNKALLQLKMDEVLLAKYDIKDDGEALYEYISIVYDKISYTTTKPTNNTIEHDLITNIVK